MKEIEAQQLFWIHTRGLVVTLPPQLTNDILTSTVKGELFSESTKSHLAVITEDPILRKRFSSSESGEELMKHVDFERRDYLFSLANDLTLDIVSSWKTVNPQKQVAVLLYGSVAKGLVKCATHPEPSDIDLTIIGDFTEDERLALLKTIHPSRERIREEVLESCPHIDEHNKGDIRYAGTMVQSIEKLTKNNYSDALHYIGSCTIPLYDPDNIWRRIENEALKIVTNKHHCSKTQRRSHKIRAISSNRDPITQSTLIELFESTLITNTFQGREFVEGLATQSRWQDDYEKILQIHLRDK